MQGEKGLRRGNYTLEPAHCRCGMEGLANDKQIINKWYSLFRKGKIILRDLMHEIQRVRNPCVQSAGPTLGCNTFLLLLLFHPATGIAPAAPFVPGTACMCCMEPAQV